MFETGGTGAGSETKVPGLDAPEVLVPQLLNSLPRLLLKAGDGLSQFLHSMLGGKPSLRDEGTPLGLWPIPIPFPEAFRSSDGGEWRKRRLALQIVVLDWLFLGKPAACPASLCIGRRLTAKQWRVVTRMEFLAEDMNSVFRVAAQDMGRSAAKTEMHDGELAALHRACSFLTSNAGMYGICARSSSSRAGNGLVDVGSSAAWGEVVGSVPATANFTAKKIEADRIKFGQEPRFDPLPYLDAKTAAMYEHPENFFKDEPDEPPAVSIRATNLEKLKLFRKMAECKRLAALSPAEVDQRYASGLFAVCKNLEWDRLIMDCRPANGREIGLQRWTSAMASAGVLSQIELAADENLAMSGEDVQDYFYQFVISDARRQRNVLIGKLEQGELEAIFQRPLHFQGPGFVCLSTMAMGDLCACEFAQGSHLSVLFSSGQLSPNELVMMHCPLPRTPLMIGVVIDDLVLLERVLQAGTDGESRASSRLKPIKSTYARVGLPINEKKEFVDSPTGSFWGCQIDGVKGILRPSNLRLWPLVMITMRVSTLGLVTIGLLESLVGSWVAILMFRRRLLSLLSLCFDILGSNTDKGSVVRLSGKARDELLAIAVCGPLSYVNLRAETLGTIRATDSSDWGAAGVSADLPVSIAREAMRHSLSKSRWTHLLPPFKAWQKLHDLLDPSDELPDGDRYNTHPLWSLLACGLTYREEWRAPHIKKRHINFTELGAYLKEESRVAGRHSSARILYGLDSQVALGALVKGRSASKSLNSLLQRSIAIIVGSDVYSGFGYFPSSTNRADAPTRDAVPPAPDVELPSWWESASQGDFSAFDRWLKVQEQHADLVSPERQFDFTELGFKPVPLLQTGSKLHSRSRSKSQKNFPLCKTDGGSAESGTGSHDHYPSDNSKSSQATTTLSQEAIDILQSFSAEQVWWPRGDDKVFRSPGALDLFTGRGGVAKALLRSGAPFVVTFEWKRSSAEDLLQDHNRRRIVRLVELKAVLLVGLAVICSSFSVAITPPVRTSRFPRGVPWASLAMRKKISEGNSHADFAALLISVCLLVGVDFWLENPDTSYLWRQKGFELYRDASSPSVFRLDYCRFGTPWRKRTRVASSIDAINGIRCFCKCGVRHLALRGTHPTLKIPWTAVAEPYPRAFADLIGYAASAQVGWSKRKLNIAGCCRGLTLRIGEAKNPGPRGVRSSRGFSLEFAPVQSASSVALGDKCWISFIQWCCRFLSADPIEVFVKVPLFLVHAIRKYGDAEFCAGGSLLYYRHLVLTAQRRMPGCKQFIHIAWDLATRWEAVEPTTHRMPMPLVIVQAMIVVGWNLGWKRWCGVTALAYFGIARIGEVLNCKRKDLLLPADLIDEQNVAAFLLLRRSKTSFRQAAKVQHLKIKDCKAVQLLEFVYKEFNQDVFLFHGSPNVYRRRWDVVLKMLGIEANLGLTPGGLRGGGAIQEYRCGSSIPDIQWRMRLKNVITLEAYIQEVAALSVMTTLSEQALERVKAASKLFPHLVP